VKLSDFKNGAYQVGQVIGAKACSYEACKTEPPRRYTQSDLIDDMMAAYKFAQNDQERAVLREISGLGTSRTREPTITRMIDRGFLNVVKKGRGRTELVPSDVARAIVQELPPMLTSVAMTARWELAFRLVERGKATDAEVERYLRSALDQIVNEAKQTGSIKLPAQKSKPAPANQFASKKPSAGARTGGAVAA
jgi:DNA topoisomerase-3